MPLITHLFCYQLHFISLASLTRHFGHTEFFSSVFSALSLSYSCENLKLCLHSLKQKRNGKALLKKVVLEPLCGVHPGQRLLL